MNNLPAICVAACLIPSLAAAQAAPEHHIWQDKGSFEPMSHTAQAITGPIKLSGNSNFATPGSIMTLTFGNGDAVELTSVGASWRKWSDANQEKVTAEVFRLDHDPGKLVQGNTLCGNRGPARFIVFYENLFLGRLLLGIDVFQSNNSPRDINSPGLCGTFSFYMPKTEAPGATPSDRDLEAAGLARPGLVPTTKEEHDQWGADMKFPDTLFGRPATGFYSFDHGKLRSTTAVVTDPADIAFIRARITEKYGVPDVDSSHYRGKCFVDQRSWALSPAPSIVFVAFQCEGQPSLLIFGIEQPVGDGR